MKFEITMTKTKDTPGTHVYTAPKQNDQGKANAATSVYLVKEALGGAPAPATVKVTIEV